MLLIFHLSQRETRTAVKFTVESVMPLCVLMCDKTFAAEGRVRLPFERDVGQIGHWRCAFVLHSFVLLFICLESTISVSSVDLSLDRVILVTG